jgi:hypothetical protein
MEFLIYLSPQGQQLIRDLISAKFHIHENVGLCQNRNVFGYATNPNKFVICTNNIKNSGFDPNYYVGETVYHEAVHAAQICNRNSPFSNSAKSYPLPWNKEADINKSVSISNGNRQKEREAFFFEDKPDKVRQLVKKYCF